MNTLLITEAQSKSILDSLLAKKIGYDFLSGKNELIFSKDHTDILKLRLPISISTPEAFYKHPEDKANYVLVLIRSGIASVGYFENGNPIDHKVFRAYTVRKKQGKSQIKYLKTKGKSRAGSRVRLAETLAFFEEINKRLIQYFKEFRVDRIGLSCPVTLIPYFYGAKIPTPFEKNDLRIMKVPKHVQNPTYQSLLLINQFLLKGELRFTEEGNGLLEELVETTDRDNSGMEDEENW